MYMGTYNLTLPDIIPLRLRSCMSYEEEDTCMSYEEEDTCMAYEEQDADGVGHLGPSLVHKNLRVCFCDHALGRMRERRGG